MAGEKGGMISNSESISSSISNGPSSAPSPSPSITTAAGGRRDLLSVAVGEGAVVEGRDNSSASGIATRSFACGTKTSCVPSPSESSIVAAILEKFTALTAALALPLLGLAPFVAGGEEMI